MEGRDADCTERSERVDDLEKSRSVSPRVPLRYGDLTGRIRQAAFDVHRYFGPGFLEKVYERSLVNRLHRAGLDVESQIAIPVHDEDGSIVGDFVADLLIERAVIVEVKAVGEIAAEHRAQVLNYLKATGVRVGMLVNFGRTRLQLKRFALQIHLFSVSSVRSVFSVFLSFVVGQ